MKVLVTGAAGFIGYHMSEALLKKGYKVIGIDSMNPYYDVNLKKCRLEKLKQNKDFSFYHLNLEDNQAILNFGKEHSDISYIIHLAAQAGVRYSLEAPFSYAQANLIGHLAMLELCRSLPHLKHFVYASSSSVYGANEKLPFAVEDRVDTPISLYAATKKSAELMTYSYSHLFKIPATGLRYFTVYGPWGRPDMSAFIFTKAILNDQEMPVFNHGDMRRNFTYVDDVVNGTIACMENATLIHKDLSVTHKLYNIGNNRSEKLMDFIHLIEEVLGKKAKIRFEGMQPGDVKETIAHIKDSTDDFGFKPETSIKQGVPNFVNWYRDYYNV
jgi:UDP-glucuronate 4-epimerase